MKINKGKATIIALIIIFLTVYDKVDLADFSIGIYLIIIYLILNNFID